MNFTLIFRQKKFWLLPVLILVLLAADALFLGRDGAIHLGGAGEPFPSFRTETLDGRAVTDEIFAGKTTAVCVWVLRDEAGSRAALEHFAAMAEGLPESAQFVGLVGDLKTEDGADKHATAKKLADGLSSPFPQLLVNEDFAPFLTRLRAAPTIVFIDSAGRLVGQPVVGDEPELVKKELSRLLEKDSPRHLALKKIQNALF